MTLNRLVWRGIRHYWRSYVCMGLGIALTASLISGSLILGTSVKTGLLDQALSQLGPVQWVVHRESGLFRGQLVADISENREGVHPLLYLDAVAQHPEEKFPPERVTLMGASKAFPAFEQQIPGGQAVLNQRALQLLGLKPGESLILRLEASPSQTGERPMAHQDHQPKAIRLQVTELGGGGPLRDFSLHRSIPEQANIWVDRAWLSQELGYEDSANMMVFTGSRDSTELREHLRAHWTFEDVGLSLHEEGDFVQLNAHQVVIAPHVVDTIRKSELDHVEFFGWFAFEFEHRDKKSPYGFVVGQSESAELDLKPGEVAVNQWLADDLALAPGSEMVLHYPDFGGGMPYKAVEKTFKVVEVLPMSGVGADAGLMPPFPGFSGAENCRDWQPGVTFDPTLIRPKDEAYWKAHKGAPKAVISMTDAEDIGANPYGLRSALRFPLKFREKAEGEFLKALEPERVGYLIQNLRAHHLAASEPANDLGQLFLGLGFLLMASALLLSGMLFSFVSLRREGEFNTLLAMGWTSDKCRALLVRESMIVAFLCALIGAVGGLGVARLLLDGLDSFWRSAIGSAPLGYQPHISHVVVSLGVSLILAFLVLWYAGRKMQRSPRVLSSPARSRWSTLLAFLSSLGAFVSWFALDGAQSPIGAFVAGFLALVALLFFTQVWIAGQGRGDTRSIRSVSGLALRYVRRRKGRSLAVVILSALGCFLVLAVGGNQKNPLANAHERSSGTGGFALYGESTLPLMDRADLGETTVAFRKRAGDDASCLNLGNAQTPTILGVRPDDLARRESFGVKTASPHDQDSVWHLLEEDLEAGIPIISDEGTLRWGLKLGLGDELELSVAGGRKERLVVVAMLTNNVLQGSLILSDKHFTRLFPEERGFQVFLTDASDQEVHRVGTEITERYADLGMRLMPATDRLAQFHAVENTYLDIFQALGTLGMMLGILGLAIMLLFNVMDRRSELSILWAMGFRRRGLAFLLAVEHLSLMVWGLVIGSGAALLTMWPIITSPGAPLAVDSMILALASILVTGVLSTLAALIWSLRDKDFSSSWAP